MADRHSQKWNTESRERKGAINDPPKAVTTAQNGKNI
jgi:hypothetical protein